MHRITSMAAWAVGAIALTAIGAWPTYARNGANAARAASLPTPAPVHADYLERDRLIAFWERAHSEHWRGDMLSPTNLSVQYLQRYRERGDPGEDVRAMKMAQEALRTQPYGTSAAELALGATYVALHRFADALAVTRAVERYAPGDSSMLAREASIDLELGRYDAARTIVDRLRTQPRQPFPSLDVETLIARYDELTGHLARARERFERVVAFGNARYDASAQQHAWFWFRAGELAFEAGDNDAAIAAERQALEVFPHSSEANRMLARVLCSLQRWQECLSAAQASAEVVPSPHALGCVVAPHAGDRDAGRTWLREALALNPRFHPFYADDARRLLAAPVGGASGDERRDAFREVAAAVQRAQHVVVGRAGSRIAQAAAAL